MAEQKLNLRGYISVDIPVKRYTKAYIKNKLGEAIKLDRSQRHPVTEKLYDILEREATDPDRKRINLDYPVQVTFYLTISQFSRRGATLNHTNVKSFNAFCESLIKQRFYEVMDECWEVVPGFEKHLPYVRKVIGIDEESWSLDSMKKDYYRYRLLKGKEILKKFRPEKLTSNDIAFV